MHHVLFVIEMPEQGMSSVDPDAWTRWHQFLAKSNAIPTPQQGKKKQDENVRRLAKNVWLLHGEGSSSFLSKLNEYAEESKFPYATYAISSAVEIEISKW